MTPQGIITWIEEASASVLEKSMAEWTVEANHTKLTYKQGPKYFAVSQVNAYNEELHASSYCYIDYEGNIYKSSGRRPAKGIRGNITKKLANTVPANTGWLYR